MSTMFESPQAGAAALATVQALMAVIYKAKLLSAEHMLAALGAAEARLLETPGMGEAAGYVSGFRAAFTDLEQEKRDAYPD